MNPIISIIVPLYNEEKTLTFLFERLNKVMESINVSTEVVLVNDGSKDNTESIIELAGLSDERYQIVSLSRNFGHQIAVSAGLKYARGSKAIFIIDGDLQDPPELLNDFYNQLLNGYDVVYGVRKKRKENLLKIISYKLFYRILKSISSIDIPLDSGDFCLISRRVVEILNSMPEESRYIRGLRAWAGFKQYGFEYERHERIAGDSKYSIKKLFQLAYNGIFNFSEFPIKLITRIGFIAFLTSLAYSIYALTIKILYNTVPEGFTALLFTITMFSGLQLLSIGIIGEYITRIFFQTKKRPLFVVKNHIINKKNIDG